MKRDRTSPVQKADASGRTFNTAIAAAAVAFVAAIALAAGPWEAAVIGSMLVVLSLDFWLVVARDALSTARRAR